MLPIKYIDENSKSDQCLPGDLYGNWSLDKNKIIFEFWAMVTEITPTQIKIFEFSKSNFVTWHHFYFMNVDGFFIRDSKIYVADRRVATTLAAKIFRRRNY